MYSFDIPPSKLYPFKVKVAEAFACVDEKEIGTLDIDDIGKLLEASGKPLPGKLSIVWIPRNFSFVASVKIISEMSSRIRLLYLKSLEIHAFYEFHQNTHFEAG